MSDLFSKILNNITKGVLRQVQNEGEAVSPGEQVSKISGLWGSSKALFLTELFDRTTHSIFVVTPDGETAEALLTDLRLFSRFFLSPPDLFSFPYWEILPYDTILPHTDITHIRMSGYLALLSGRRGIFVSPAYSMIQQVITPGTLQGLIKKIEPGMEMDKEALAAHLVDIGYEPSDLVVHRGLFSLRGGIVDIFSPGEEYPVRVEFFGDSIESLRSFDPETQRSVSQMESAVIMPAKELPHLENHRKQQASGGSLFEYLSDEDTLIFDEAAEIKQNSSEYWSQILEIYKDALLQGRRVAEPEKLYFPWDEIVDIRSLFKNKIDIESIPIEGTASVSINSTSLLLTETRSNPPVPPFSKGGNISPPLKMGDTGGFSFSLKDIAERLDILRKENLLVLVSPTDGQAERFRDLFIEYDVPATITDTANLSQLLRKGAEKVPSPSRGGSGSGWGSLPVHIITGHLSSGFFYPDAYLIFITEEEIFGKRGRRRPPPKQKSRPFQTSFQDLNKGDYVVHLQHGIGQYDGLVRKILSGGEGDFLCIRYSGNDYVYVPVNKMDLVQKYAGAEGHAPHIDKLQGSQWEKTRRRVEKAIEEIAEDLVELYAARMVVERSPYLPEVHLMTEFESSFEFEETPDQLTAIEDVMRDLGTQKPMDRLICGDVGYGKTEVALRAVCKVVIEGKQAAILVPTTLLAQQHYQTFARRFASFPVRVEMLSRFKTLKEQKEIIRGLAEGTIDIIIGTHGLLQKNISFRNAGIFIVDEEQRFGVSQKERLKQIRKSVDVLSLSATPIPRTLQMALLGIRDLSVIETPPEDRLAIHSVIIPFDKRIIRSAILREFDRGGSVYFVHNRIENIAGIANLLQELVPEARIGVAHGQMREKLLEDVMIKFINGDYNLLVCTAIVESGLDIPDANTIIINRADMFGLADLYQLRGRVGRSGHQAYAYLIVPADEALTSDSKKRIKAIQELTGLGAGFRLANKDLEIRGGGNLLGRKQSGHISSVGFELYTQMLDRAVKHLRGEKVEEDFIPTINLRIASFIPEEYISDSSQRLSLYKRLSSIREKEQIFSIQEEMLDRYGPVPVQVENLLKIIEIKLSACMTRVSKIEEGENGIVFTVDPEVTKNNKDILQKLLKIYANKIQFLSEYKFQMLLKNKETVSMFSEIINCLKVVGGYV
ncbi:MAG: transcription-repair coupling factor [Nitrospirae bacterium]|nr:transcription-repair coupling factor [Nitrospirota bacterium]